MLYLNMFMSLNIDKYQAKGHIIISNCCLPEVKS